MGRTSRSFGRAAAGRASGVAAITLAGAAISPGTALGAPGDVDLVSRADGAAGAKSARPSLDVSTSANGRLVAFTTEARLDPADINDVANVYVRDVVAGTTRLVTRVPPGTGAEERGSNPVISDDGSTVAYVVDALTGPDAGNTLIWAASATGGGGARVDVTSGPIPDTSNGRLPRAPSISADGRRVAFATDATNLDPADAAPRRSVYVRDIANQTTTLVSRAEGASGANANDLADVPSISGDGNVVAYRSEATNLHPEDGDGTNDVFVRDLTTGSVRYASRPALSSGTKAPTAPPRGSDDPELSADGSVVAFESAANNLDAADADNVLDVYVRDLVSDRIALASRATGPSGAKGDGASQDASLSADGRSVAFESGARNLDPADADTGQDVYVRDLSTGTLALASRAAGPTGVKGNGASQDPALSADGRAVAFPSSATNLSPDDADANPDTFRRLLPVPASEAPAPPGTPTQGPSAPPASPTPPASPAATVPRATRAPAKLAVRHARVVRDDRRLDLLASVAARATGTVQISFRAAGRTSSFQASIENGRIRVRRAITAAQAELGTGIVTISYPGDTGVRPQTLRVRAASRPARLTASRPRISDTGTLTTRGTIGELATGRVRVELAYATDAGRTRQRVYTARIGDGRWNLDTRLPAIVRQQIAGRRGTVQATITYTGELSSRTGGESRTYEVLGNS